MDIFETLYAARDEAKAAPMVAYMKNHFPFLGIKTPEFRVLTKDFLRERKKDKAVDWAFIRKCYGLPEREFHYLGLAYLGVVSKLLMPDDTEAIEKLITTNSWWDTVDTVDAYVGELCLRYPDLKKTLIPQWITSENIWLKRVSINYQLRFKEQTDTDMLRSAILPNTGTGEFFVDKAIGWALRGVLEDRPGLGYAGSLMKTGRRSVP